jgi:hypothetical protein
MTITRTVVAILIASFLTAVVPQIASADESHSRASADLRASIDRAAATFAATTLQPSTLLGSAPSAASAMQSAGGGGGGKGRMIWTVVGTLSSVATTYFVVKEVRKQTEKMAGQQ